MQSSSSWEGAVSTMFLHFVQCCNQMCCLPLVNLFRYISFSFQFHHQLFKFSKFCHFQNMSTGFSGETNYFSVFSNFSVFLALLGTGCIILQKKNICFLEFLFHMFTVQVSHAENNICSIDHWFSTFFSSWISLLIQE